MVTITKYPDKYRDRNGVEYEYKPGTKVYVPNLYDCVFEFDFGSATSLSDFSIKIFGDVTIVNSSQAGGGVIYSTLYDDAALTNQLDFKTFRTSSTSKLNVSHSASITTNSQKLWLKIHLSNLNGHIGANEATVSAEVPISVEVSPSQVYTGSSVTLNFPSRFGRELNVEFYYNSTKLNPDPITAASDSISVTCPESWFSTAGVTGNSMSVKARANDGSGQTSPDASFTLVKATSSLTTVAPKSQTVDGTQAITFSWSYSGAGTLTKTELQWSPDNANWEDFATIDGSGTTYTVPAYSFTAGIVYWRGRATNSLGLTGDYPASGTSFTVGFPTLTTGVTPSQLYADNSVTLDFTNRLGQTISVDFYYNTTKLNSSSITAGGDSISVNCPESWFSTAGVTGNSMTVKARASDELGRQAADASFTLMKPTGGSIVTAAPKSTTVDGTKSITFSWSYSGGGTLTKTELQWSPDNANWEDLATIDGSGTTYSVPAYSFTAGAVYWRGRATNSFGLVGSYSAGASFTVGFPTLTTGVTPSQLYADNSVTLDFTNRLGKTISVDFYYNTTKLNSSSVTANNDSVVVNCPGSWFSTAGVTGNSMSVKARASDELGRHAADASFTLMRATGGSIVTAAPKSTTVDGTKSITFSWSYSGDGTLTKTELQWSYDNASWTSLATVNGSGTTYSIPSYMFNAGTVYWRGRATNSFGIPGSYPASGTSFTVQYPTLTTGVTPSQLYAGNPITLDFTNRLGKTVSVDFYYNTTKLNLSPVTANNDSVVVNCPESWFSTAGVTGNSMSVKARATDTLGRTAADASFTLKLATGGSISPSAPRSSRLDGTETIVFQWSYSGDGTLSTTYLQWSGDGENWQALATVTGGDTTKAIDALTFPAGTIYWRAKARNSLGVDGSWCNPVSFTVVYNATSQVVPSETPTSGKIDAESDQVFKVTLEASAPVFSPFQIASAAFYWRVGYSGEYTELAMAPALDRLTASVTIEAGTFPSGTIQWYAEATDTAGSTTLTDTYTLTALNNAIETYPSSPINTIERGNGPIVFRWTYTSLDGSDQNGAELEYSQDLSAWHSLGSVPATETSYTAPAGSLPGGIVYWHVRSRTQGGSWGLWSQAVSFQSFSAPIVQGVVATDVPVSTITWQVEGQLAYEIQVDGKRYGPYFGERVRSYVLQEPLADGLHTVKVRAQNKYGLWSEWAENTVIIQNLPGPDITLFGFDLAGAVLYIVSPSWQGKNFVYRDGKLIGKTTDIEYYDIRVIGTHRYYVLHVEDTGYYLKSNTVEIDCPVHEPWLGLLPSGPSMVLRLSENANRLQTITKTREVAYTQYAGSKYPEAEVGIHESLTVTGDVSFTLDHPEMVETFESFFGKKVIYKTPGGLCVEGILEGFQRRDPKHYKSYTFSITQMDWEDFYDADSSLPI